jgi:hypothetical protein
VNWQQLLLDGYGRVLGELERALDGVSRSDLNIRPHPDCNSMGWLAWHLTRVQDDHIADLAGDEQLYIKDGWYSAFDCPADPHDVGFGHSPEQVAAFRSPDIATILDYHRSVLERTRTYVTGLSEKELDRELNEPWFQPLPTVGVRLVSVLSDSLQHTGQIAYIRGLLKGKGWSKI